MCVTVYIIVGRYPMWYVCAFEWVDILSGMYIRTFGIELSCVVCTSINI